MREEGLGMRHGGVSKRGHYAGMNSSMDARRDVGPREWQYHIVRVHLADEGWMDFTEGDRARCAGYGGLPGRIEVACIKRILETVWKIRSEVLAGHDCGEWHLLDSLHTVMLAIRYMRLIHLLSHLSFVFLSSLLFNISTV